MGIRGLTKYINGNPKFFEDYELHGGYLVIDAASLMCELYSYSRCNDAFGGDHDAFAQTVSEFFDDLAKCEVTPLLIFDGPHGDKKKETSDYRRTNQIELAKHYNPLCQEQLRPMSVGLSFMDVLRKKSIRKCRELDEADASIAGVAKVLNCPVLSRDSDFYLFGVSYIPMTHLDPFVTKKDGVYIKRCSIYRVENLLRCFPGLDAKVFMLVAILLGNDYIQPSVLENFFEAMNITPRRQRVQYNELQRKIHITLHWLKNHGLDEAVAAILSTLEEKRRRRALYMIELVVNGYIDTPCELLKSLGFQDLYRDHMSKQQFREPFKFQGDIEKIERVRSWRDERVSKEEMSSVDGDDSSSDERNEDNDFENVGTTRMAEVWPSWFAQKYLEGEFPIYFLNIINLRKFTAPIQIEDYNYPSVNFTSLRITRVIDGLLMAGRSDQISGLLYSTRNGDDSDKFQFKKILSGTQSVKFPTLAKLEDTQIDIKKRIIDDTLGVTGKESFLQDLPPDWRLYVAAIFYWKKSSEQPRCDSCHMYAILLGMLISVIDKKIGFYRSLDRFNEAHGQTITDILSKRTISKSDDSANFFDQSNSIIEAIESVTQDDCLVGAPFFIFHRLPQQQLIDDPYKYNPTIVHVFSQFQFSLGAAIHLNALLGYPYEHTNISEFYNGTMLYNFYTNFKKSSDVEDYISVTLNNSPSLLKLIKLLISKMKNMLGEGVVEAANGAT